MSILSGLKDLVETAGGIWLQGEQINANTPTAGNDPSDYPHVPTGTNSDGTTLIKGQLISGVSNVWLAAGLGVLILGVLAAWVATDD